MAKLSKLAGDFTQTIERHIVVEIGWNIILLFVYRNLIKYIKRHWIMFQIRFSDVVVPYHVYTNGKVVKIYLLFYTLNMKKYCI